MFQTGRRSQFALVIAVAFISLTLLSSTGCAKKQVVTLTEVQRPKPAIQSIEPDSTEVHQGETLVITLNGDAGLRASAKVGWQPGEILLNEEEGGKGIYHGFAEVPGNLVERGGEKSFDLSGRLEVTKDNFVTASGPAVKVLGEPLPPPHKPGDEPARVTAAEANSSDPLSTIYFDFDQFAVRAEARGSLEATAEKLKKHSWLKVKIEGYCDERGTNEYNMTLGDRRANSAKNILIALGIDASRIITISYGEENPLEAGHNEAAWAKNRRAHLIWED